MKIQKKTFDKFNQIYNKTQGIDSSKNYLEYLCYFYDKFNKDIIIKKIFDSIKEEQKKETQKYHQKLEMADQKLETINNEVKSYGQENKILYIQKEGPLSSFGNNTEHNKKEIDWKQRELFWKLENLAKAGHYNFVSRYAIVYSEHHPNIKPSIEHQTKLPNKFGAKYEKRMGEIKNNIEEYCSRIKWNENITSTLKELDEEWEKIEQNKKTKIWYHYQTLKFICGLYRNSPEALRMSYEEGEFLEVLSIGKEELPNIPLVSKDNTAHLVDRESLNLSLDKLLDHIKEKIETQQAATKKQKKIVKISESDNKIIVKYGTKQQEFNLNYRNGRFIKAHLPDPHKPKSDKKIWSKIEGQKKQYSLDIQEKKKLEETRKSVNKRLKNINLSNAFQRTEKIDGIEEMDTKHWFNKKYKIEKP